MFSVTEKAVNRMLLRSCEIASPGKSDCLSLRPDNHDAFSLTMWQGNGGADQRFVFVPVDETYHRILTLRKDAADRPFLGVERQSGEVVVGATVLGAAMSRAIVLGAVVSRDIVVVSIVSGVIGRGLRC